MKLPRGTKTRAYSGQTAQLLMKTTGGTIKATTMKLLVSHQPILQECMRAGGFTHYLIITIVRLYIHDIAGNHNYKLQLHLSDY